MSKQSGKGLRRAIVEADKALDRQKAKANAAEPVFVSVEVVNFN